MAIALDPTIGGPDSNAYVDVDYVEEVADVSGDAGVAWKALTDEQKVGTILAGTRAVNAQRFIGEPATTTQRLKFPMACLERYADDIIPLPVQEATALESIARAPQYKTAATIQPLPTPATAGLLLKRKKTGPLEKEYFAPPTVSANSAQTLTADAQQALEELLYDATELALSYGASTQERTS